MKILPSVIAVILLLGITACTPVRYEITARTIFAMDTVAVITIYGNSRTADDDEAAIDAAFERLSELDKRFSYTNPESELSNINSKAYDKLMGVSQDMGYVIEQGLLFAEMTDGAFDISLGSLIDLWDGEQPPSQEQLDALLPNLGYENIEYDGNTRAVRFSNPSVKMHFGAIAKGYAVDQVRRLLVEKGVKSAIIDIGGEVAVLGRVPGNLGQTRSHWTIGIRDPFGESEYIDTISLKLGIIATSGMYERPDHIFDPNTGYPVQSEFASVSVIAGRGEIADALSTAIFVSGVFPEWKGMYCAVTVSKEGEVKYIHRDGYDFFCGINSSDNADLD